MSNSDVAACRLRVVRDLPLLLEAAFRAAAREIVFVRPAARTFAGDMKARARFHLESLVRASDVGTLDLGEAHVALDRAVDRFSRTPLRRRLCALPVARLHAIAHPDVDLVIDDRDGRRFTLRFAGLSRPVPSAVSPRTFAPVAGVGAHLVYDIDRGRFRRRDVGIRLPRSASKDASVRPAPRPWTNDGAAHLNVA